jgi:hypothetical protein
MQRGRGEHERVGIDSTPCRTTLICWWMQRGARGVEGGEDTPPTEALADRQRARGHDRSSAHEVNPDVPSIRFGTGVIKDGDGRWGGAASVAQIHHEVADNALPDVELMQPRLAPVQQLRRGSIVKISGRRDDDRDHRIGGGPRRHDRDMASAVARSILMLSPSAVPDLIARVDRPFSVRSCAPPPSYAGHWTGVPAALDMPHRRHMVGRCRRHPHRRSPRPSEESTTSRQQRPSEHDSVGPSSSGPPPRARSSAIIIRQTWSVGA